VPIFGLFGSITLLVALVVGGAAQNWGPFVGAMFYVFVNDFARSVGENPSDSIFLGWFVDEGTKLNGLGGVVFGVLLILFARFVPLGAVGTMRIWRAKAVVVVPKMPIPAGAMASAASTDTTLETERDPAGAGAPTSSQTSVTDVDPPRRDDEAAP